MLKIEKIQLESDEYVLMHVRKHWFLLATQIFGVVVLALFPLIAYEIMQNVEGLPVFPFVIPVQTLIGIYTAWVLILWMNLFNIWTNYYLDVWTITNKRLITVDQHGFFSRTIATFRLERIQDIVTSVSGIIPTLLDFGSLEIQTASEEAMFKMDGLPKPGELKAVILAAADGLSAEESAQITKGV